MKVLIKKYWRVVILTAGLVLFFEHYEEVTKAMDAVPVLKDLKAQLSVMATIMTGFGVLWFQKYQEAKSSSRTVLVATVLRLRSQYDSSVNTFCRAVEEWGKGGSIVFYKFSHNVGDLQWTDVDGLSKISSLNVELIQEIVDAEEHLVWLYNTMERINGLMDELDAAPPVRKQEYHEVILSVASDGLKMSAQFTKEFKEVSISLVEELNTRGEKFKMDWESVDDLLITAESIKYLFEKVKPALRYSALDSFYKPETMGISYKYPNGQYEEISGAKLIGGMREELIRVTAQYYGESVALEFAAALDNWLVAFFRRYFQTQAVEKTQNERGASNTPCGTVESEGVDLGVN